MGKKYNFKEFRWHFLSKEVDRFDLRKFYDKGRYVMRQIFEEMKENKLYEEKEVRKGNIVRILRIENFENSGFCDLRNSA